MFIAQRAFSQSILEESSLDSTQLDSAQLVNYQKISHNEEFLSYSLIEVQDLVTLQDSGRVTINMSIFPCSPVTFLARNVDYTDQDNYTWYGEIVTETDSTCSEGVMFMLAYEGEKFGYIKVDSLEYLYHDLGGGVQILARLDSTFGEFICGVVEDEEEEFSSSSSSSSFLEECSGGCDIRVFVHYTEKARSRFGTKSLEQRIRLAIAQANQALRNSAVQSKIKIVLAGIAFLDDFDETTNMENDLRSYEDRTDVQTDRTNYEADVAFLFCKGKDSYGTRGASYQNAFNASRPYGIVDTRLSTNDDYVFTHELGHIMNAHHLYPTTRPGFNKAHQIWVGWLFNNTRVVTMMHNGDIGWHRRILNFSNPDVYYKKDPTGIEDERDNARAIDDFACTIANIYSNPTPPVTGVISGYNVACGCKSADYWVTAGCGTPPYSYEWQISYDGIDYVTVGTNSYLYSTELLCNPQIYTLFIRVIITDDNSSTAMLSKSVMVAPTWSLRTCDAGVITERKKVLFSLTGEDHVIKNTLSMSARPIPANNFVIVDVVSGVDGPLSLEFIDINGRAVKKETRLMQQGKASYKLDVSSMSPGVYFIIGRTASGITTQKIIVN
jgi:hypothetical protein